MRYPRLLIVMFVAFGLAVAPGSNAFAASGETAPEAIAEAETLAEIARESAAAATLARRGGLVESLVRVTDMDYREAGLFIDAATDLVLAIAATGERAGMIASPDDDDELLDAVFAAMESTDARSAQASAKVDYLTERATDAAGHVNDAERRAMEALADRSPTPTAGPVERWRPLVETYFPGDLVEEALSIIDCESNGDPDVRNRRSGASGLFQFIPGTWVHASDQAGFAGFSPFEPEANVAAAAWLVGYSLDAGAAPWAHWTCRP